MIGVEEVHRFFDGSIEQFGRPHGGGGHGEHGPFAGGTPEENARRDDGAGSHEVDAGVGLAADGGADAAESVAEAAGEACPAVHHCVNLIMASSAARWPLKAFSPALVMELQCLFAWAGTRMSWFQYGLAIEI